jgi:hypothetical protein
MRSVAYVEWLKAARFLGLWPPDEPLPRGNLELPHPAYNRQLRELTTEASVLSSKRVAAAIVNYLDRAHHVDVSTARTPDEAAALVNIATIPERHAVINAMRRDLGTWKLPRDLTAAPSSDRG